MDRLTSTLNNLALQPPPAVPPVANRATSNLAALARAQAARSANPNSSVDDAHDDGGGAAAIEVDELCTECCNFKAMVGFDVCGYCKRKSEHAKRRAARKLHLGVVNHIKKADREARHTRHAARNLKKLGELLTAKMRERDSAWQEFGALFAHAADDNDGANSVACGSVVPLL